MLDSLRQDVVFAFRLLRRNPRNTVFAVLILGLGIGANTAMFSAVSYVLIHPLPFRDTEHALRIRNTVVATDGQTHPYNMRARDILTLKTVGSVFDGIVAFSGENLTLSGGDLPERLSVVFQTAGAEMVLGVPPAFGRSFTPEEERQGLTAGVALISDTFWASHFGRISAAIGSTLRLDGRPFTVIGVMPPQYAFPYEAQVWIPFALDAEDSTRDFAVFARVSSGRTDADVRGAVDLAAAHIRRRYADVRASYRISVEPIRDSLVGNQTAPLMALTTVVGFLLLVASVNVATLLLARSVVRRREFAMRAILGASRARHVRQLAAESCVLATLGGLAGLLLVTWIARFTSTLMPSVFSLQLGLGMPVIDSRVLGFTAFVSLASAAIAGLIPAFGSWRSDPYGLLADSARTITTGKGGRRLLATLIGAETGLTLVLLAGAGLVIANFVRLAASPLGFDAQGLLAIELTPPASVYPTGAPRADAIARMVDEIAGTPGVTSAAATTVNPLGGGTWFAPVVSEETALRNPGASFNVNDRIVSPSLFETMRTPILLGRAFSAKDGPAALPVVIVSERLARSLWPGGEAIGKRVRIAVPGARWMTVVGVAADVSDAHEAGVPRETWYRPIAQNPGSAALEHVFFMVRAPGDPLRVARAAALAIARVDKSLAPFNAEDMTSYARRMLARERLSAAFMLSFGVFGLALAMLGIYAVVAFSTAQRLPEFGIRVALGARRADIVPLALNQSLVPAATGLLGGAVAALELNRVLASVLTKIPKIDAGVLGAAALKLVAAATAAALVPTFRAARVDPAIALKIE